jgi:TolB-like protein
VVEHGDDLLIAMELLEGESLKDRLSEGLLSVAEARTISLEVLEALEAVHDSGLVHRDLKPANIILTRHGVKLLDFGLSRTPPSGETQEDLAITRSGQAVGTPRYMSPEQWVGAGLGPSCDLFAMGAILFEMLSGRPAIVGRTMREVAEDALQGQPPELPGEPRFTGLENVIQKALARRPNERYLSARDMACALMGCDIRADASGEGNDHTIGDTSRGEALASPALSGTATRDYTRLIVLPLRVLRTDPETDFLAFSLPEAVMTSLSRLESIVVCSHAGVAGLDESNPDIRMIAEQVSVDAVLSGSLIRAGAQVRVTTQLIEVPSGTVLRANTSQATLEDIFQLQDQIAREIVNSLSIDVSPQDQEALGIGKPVSGRAYEIYLRANQLATSRSRLVDARDLYESCLELDPEYAPAWARLGRVYRILAKYSLAGDVDTNLHQAKDAFHKALQLDPDLSIAHNLYTFHEVEELGRSRDAMVRLLRRAHSRRNDPQLFAGLVTACRFCGLTDASLAAHQRARRLDPGIPTSVQYTHLLRCEWEEAMRSDDEDMKYTYNHALAMVGRTAEAIARYRDMEKKGLEGLDRFLIAGSRAALEGKREECLATAQTLVESSFRDPEGQYLVARELAYVGADDFALEVLENVVGRGFTAYSTLLRDPWLDSLRETPRFRGLVSRAEEGARAAETSYLEADGPRILGTVFDREQRL